MYDKCCFQEQTEHFSATLTQNYKFCIPQYEVKLNFRYFINLDVAKDDDILDCYDSGSLDSRNINMSPSMHLYWLDKFLHS